MGWELSGVIECFLLLASLAQQPLDNVTVHLVLLLQYSDIHIKVFVKLRDLILEPSDFFIGSGLLRLMKQLSK
jgi:hypothetical protein